MKDPWAMSGQYGMLQTFGGDYFNKMNEFQRFAASRAAIDNGLLKGDHGDIIVTDPEKLKGLLLQYQNDEKVQQEYNAAKANQAKPGTAQMNQATQGSGLDDILNSAISSANAAASSATKTAKAQNVLRLASQSPSAPNLMTSGGGVRTGVDSLDSILGSII